VGTSLTLFRVFGIEVRVHWSFLLILIYGAFAFSASGLSTLLGALYGVFVILLLFVCVTLHEFGHALAALYFKVKVPSITLLPIGGVASLERMPDRPQQEFLITLAGPAVNFAIAALLLPVTMVVLAAEMQGRLSLADLNFFMRNVRDPGAGNLLVYLVGTNILLGLFNLLPAFPMDGGRILRSLLAMALPYIQATRIAVFVGRLMAVFFAVWGIFDGNIFMLLIAFFVYVGGSSEREAVESRAVLRQYRAGQALTRSAARLYVSELLERAVDLTMNTYQTDYPVMDLGGRFAGVLTRPRLLQVLKESGPQARIVDAMLRADAVPACRPDANLADVWETMTMSGSRVVVVKDGEQFLGLLTIDDITEVFHMMSATQDYDSQRPGPGAGRPAPGESTLDA
jgi:stage IV sporulation protein FB